MVVLPVLLELGRGHTLFALQETGELDHRGWSLPQVRCGGVGPRGWPLLPPLASRAAVTERPARRTGRRRRAGRWAGGVRRRRPPPGRGGPNARFGQDPYIAAGGHLLDEGEQVELLDEGELGPLHRSEAPAAVDDRSEVHADRVGGVDIPLGDPRELGTMGSDSSRSFQTRPATLPAGGPGRPRPGPPGLEPVEGLGHRHGVEAGVGQGELLGGGPDIGTPGTIRANTSRMEGDGSAATQVRPRWWSSRVSLPVPAARSSTRLERAAPPWRPTGPPPRRDSSAGPVRRRPNRSRNPSVRVGPGGRRHSPHRSPLRTTLGSPPDGARTGPSRDGRTGWPAVSPVVLGPTGRPSVSVAG